jgi:hypothetical protein
MESAAKTRAGQTMSESRGLVIPPIKARLHLVSASRGGRAR